MLLRLDLPAPPPPRPLPLLPGLWLFSVAGEIGYLGPLESRVLPCLAVQRPPCITGGLDPGVQWLRVVKDLVHLLSCKT